MSERRLDQLRDMARRLSAKQVERQLANGVRQRRPRDPASTYFWPVLDWLMLADELGMLRESVDEANRAVLCRSGIGELR